MNSRVFASATLRLFHRGENTPLRFFSKFKSKSRVTETMPKSLQQLFLMQQQRQKIKKKSENYSPSLVSLQVLGTGARGAPRALYVSTTHKKYLFNCGEGTQRLCYEHRHRLTKLEHIFITTPTWENLGGLPGIALTVQDTGVPEITLHGPKGTPDLFKAVDRFMHLTGLSITEATCKENQPYVDQTMTVQYVPLFKSVSESSSDSENEPASIDDVDYYAYDVNDNGKRSSSQEENRTKIRRTDSPVPNGRIVGTMAYICKLQPKAGTLQLDLCVDKGVPPGPLLGKLKAGIDVTLPDGTVVLSSDVCSPLDPGPVFIVLEIPDEEYLDSLLKCDAFDAYQASGIDEDIAHCVVHFTPEKIIKDPRYREWMEKFAPTTKHLIINEENSCMGSEAVHRIQHKLHLLHPEIFPFLSEDGITSERTEEKNATKNDSEVPEKFPLIHRLKTLDAVHLRPLTSFDTSCEPILRPREYIDETFSIDGFLDVLAELQTEINARKKNNPEAAEYPKIVMLGTGSCIPNKTRNTSGILLRIDEKRSIILDCGEGTFGQLIRFYGKEVDKILSTIKAVYVSHLHADHHLGLIGLLHQCSRVTDEPIVLFAPEQISSWLYLYHKRFEHISDKYTLVPNRNLSTREALQGIEMTTTLVKHCPHSFGVSLTLENGYKIVYSGDTMPCDNLVNLGTNCDLLIHEATMEDELIEEAQIKRHSTISQAINMGERMNAKFILLTHFSQRYSKMPHLPNDGLDLSKVGIAYDNMQVSVSQLSLLPLLYPGLKLMFNEFCTILEEKSNKRQKTRLQKEKDALNLAHG